jgi:hypothetical protein
MAREMRDGRSGAAKSWRSCSFAAVWVLLLAGLAFLPSSVAASPLAWAWSEPRVIDAPALNSEPMATESAGGLKPAWVMDSVAKAVGVIARQHGFAVIRPKKVTMSGDRATIWAGPNTCRPGHDNDPLLFFIRDYPSKGVVGDCNQARSVHSAKHDTHPRDYYTEAMSAIGSRAASGAGVRGKHGDTTRIKADLTEATFTFKCNPADQDTVRSLTTDKHGRKKAIQECKKRSKSALASRALNTPALASEQTLPGAPEAGAVEDRSVVIGRCKTTDSPSTTPQWHFNSRFTTPNGKEPVHSVRPGGLTRFTAQVAGGNVDAFTIDAALVYYSTPGIKIPKSGSHPEWTPAGGLPHWAVKNLCHWKDKRDISFLVQFGTQSKIGQKACLGLQLGSKTREVPDDPPVKRYCLKVK